MNKHSDFSLQNRAFLDLASQFGFGRNKKASTSNNFESCQQSEQDATQNSQSGESSSFNKMVLELLHLQEEIGKLQMKKRLLELSEKCFGLTESSFISWLLDDLIKVSDDLGYILDNSDKIQLKLANPAISNSLPLHSTLHQPLVHLTELLSEIGAISKRYLVKPGQ